MPTDLDELLRRELPLLLPTATISQDSVRNDVHTRARRHQRRRILSGGLAAVAVLGAAVTAGMSGRQDPLSTASTEPNAVGQLPTLVALQARGGPDGTAEVRLRFDVPLPDTPITPVTNVDSFDGFDAIEAPGIVVLSQPASAVRVCDSMHYFPGDGPGSLDVLVPASWLRNSKALYDPVEPTFSTLPPQPGDEGVGPAKVIACGPYNAYVQVSVWGGEPASLNDVDVQLSTDRTEIVVLLD